MFLMLLKILKHKASIFLRRSETTEISNQTPIPPPGGKFDVCFAYLCILKKTIKNKRNKKQKKTKKTKKPKELINLL